MNGNAWLCLMGAHTAHVLSGVRGSVTNNNGVLDLMIGFIDTYTFTHLGTTGNYSAIAILHTFTVRRCTSNRILSSLVVSWQRISNSLTVTSTHT
jgi:hypothetical protein